jgi:hypothetical protein
LVSFLCLGRLCCYRLPCLDSLRPSSHAPKLDCPPGLSLTLIIHGYWPLRGYQLYCEKPGRHLFTVETERLPSAADYAEGRAMGASSPSKDGPCSSRWSKIQGGVKGTPRDPFRDENCTPKGCPLLPQSPFYSVATCLGFALRAFAGGSKWLHTCPDHTQKALHMGPCGFAAAEALW